MARDDPREPSGRADEQEQLERVITFELGRETYGVPISRVVEVITVKQIQRPPDMPAYICGVIDARGMRTVVFDLAERLGVQARTAGDLSQRMLLVSVRGGILAVSVDAVSQVAAIDPTRLATAPGPASGSTSPITGVVDTDGTLVIMLDTDRLLARRELQELADYLSTLARTPG